LKGDGCVDEIVIIVHEGGIGELEVATSGGTEGFVLVPIKVALEVG